MEFNLYILAKLYTDSEVYQMFEGIQMNITEYIMGDKENLLDLDEDCPPEDEVLEEKKDEKVKTFLKDSNTNRPLKCFIYVY